MGSADYDYALVKLKTPVKFDDDFEFVLGINFSNKDSPLSIYGYPGNDNYKVHKDGSISEGYQRGLERKGIMSIEENSLTYDITTVSGQSGCPIIVGEEKNMVIGVHKGNIKDDYKVARFINLGMIVRLEIWREACKGDPFKVVDLKTNKPINLKSHEF